MVQPLDRPSPRPDRAGPPPAEDLVVRPADYADPDAVALTAAVQAYYVGLYGGSDDSPLDPTELRPPGGRFWLGYLAGVPVAMAGWRLLDAPLPAGRRVAEVRRMYVAEAGRRRGYARRLLAEIEASAAAAGIDALVLTTGEPQADAVRFYRACGYRDVAPFGFYAAMRGAVFLGRTLTEPISSSG
ncbi:MAG: hypothetical protein JWP61_2111 [Friedmanniella sp.]|nr:hypothetical protein [Friedmanniella sp.]